MSTAGPCPSTHIRSHSAPPSRGLLSFLRLILVECQAKSPPALQWCPLSAWGLGAGQGAAQILPITQSFLPRHPDEATRFPHSCREEGAGVDGCRKAAGVRQESEEGPLLAPKAQGAPTAPCAVLAGTWTACLGGGEWGRTEARQRPQWPLETPFPLGGREGAVATGPDNVAGLPAAPSLPWRPERQEFRLRRGSEEPRS